MIGEKSHIPVSTHPNGKTGAGGEKSHTPISGYPMLLLGIVLAALPIALEMLGIRVHALTLGSIVLAVLAFAGLFVVNPNDSRVLVLFGTYVGTVKRNGFWWANPFYNKKKRITLRARNLNGQKLKVNDKAGNPIEIAAVVVWQVEDTFRAAFEVDDYEQYVVVQSEAAVRHLAGSYPYDTFEPHDEEALTLRAGAEQVARVLESELTERCRRAGVRVIEARLTHLAYAPEIAEAMLRRQAANAVVAARTQIVNGAVGMVELALQRLADRHVVDLDEERKATMVSNLLVVLCGESAVSPVVNTGTLYQ